MAIKMVREPSETPNINNIDDIIPMRYAYGGQNGYIIGKGQEISNTINGSNFVIKSGRLVLQGVECDIDATGVTISIDNIATKRYYSVYLQVNLATNNVSIGNTYDTADYPVIDSGDDLTENSSGIARMVLYKFIAQNGIISEVNKVVESIQYTPKFVFDNNSVLKIGDIIIPQKKLLFGLISKGISGTTFTEICNVDLQHKLEIHFYTYPCAFSDNVSSYYTIIIDPNEFNDAVRHIHFNTLTNLSFFSQVEGLYNRTEEKQENYLRVFEESLFIKIKNGILSCQFGYDLATFSNGTLTYPTVSETSDLFKRGAVITAVYQIIE